MSQFESTRVKHDSNQKILLELLKLSALNKNKEGRERDNIQALKQSNEKGGHKRESITFQYLVRLRCFHFKCSFDVSDAPCLHSIWNAEGAKFNKEEREGCCSRNYERARYSGRVFPRPSSCNKIQLPEKEITKPVTFLVIF